MAEREHRDPSQEALQKQKKKGRAVWLGLAVAAAVVVLAAVGVCAAAHGSQHGKQRGPVKVAGAAVLCPAVHDRVPAAFRFSV